MVKKPTNVIKCLTHGQEKFCQLVAEGETPADALAQSFSYNAGMSLSRLLSLPKIQIRIAEIRVALEGLGEEAKQTQVYLRDTLRDMMDVHIGDIMSWDEDTVRVKRSDELTTAQLNAIKSVRVMPGGQGIELVLQDKLSIAKLLAQVEGIGNSDVNVSQTNFVIRAPETAASSGAWEHQAQHFIDHDEDNQEGE